MFILGEAGTDEVMRVGEAEGSHFVHGLIGGPVFLGHAVGRNHHSGAVIAQAAVHKNFLALVVVHHLQEFGEYFVSRPGTVPGNRHVFHPQALHLFFFVFAVGMCIHHNIHAHFFQCPKTFAAQKASTIQRRGDLAEIGNAPFVEPTADRPRRGGLRFLLGLGRCRIYPHRDGE